MTKFIITGDWHVKGIAPRARLDDFKTSLFRKIREVFSLAAKHQAAAIIVPGDILDSPQTTLGTLAELGRLLQDAPCPVLTIPGNHDLWGGNPASKFRTPYGLLAQLGLVQDLTFREFIKENLWNKEPGIYVSGHSFTVETDTPLGVNQFQPPSVTDASGQADPHIVQIHVVHSMLMDRRPGFDMRHTLISEVKTNAKVIISGHEHLGFGIKQREDGVLFINPGALCRLSAHVAEIERQIQVALLTIENGQTSAELILIKSALPGHEVLSREHLENEVEREARLDKFLSLLASEGESKFLEVRDIIEDIAARDNLPTDVKADALRRIGEAREQLGIQGAKTGVAV